MSWCWRVLSRVVDALKHGLPSVSQFVMVYLTESVAIDVIVTDCDLLANRACHLAAILPQVPMRIYFREALFNLNGEREIGETEPHVSQFVGGDTLELNLWQARFNRHREEQALPNT